MMVHNNDAKPVELVLSLTGEAVGILDELVSYDLSHDGTREGLALTWVIRWGRRPTKDLCLPNRYGTGSEPMTIMVDHPLWEALFTYGSPQRMWPDEVASAVVNDWGGQLAWHKSHGTMM